MDPHDAKFDNSNPYRVARSFVTALLKDRPSGYKTFALRKDSYTDRATGVTYVYYRQMIKGIQVSDGDVNVSVKDGAVILHGDSVSIVGTTSAGMALILSHSFTMAVCPSSMSRSFPTFIQNFATKC